MSKAIARTTGVSQQEMLDIIYKANFEMLQYFKRICTDNNIAFYMWGGTLLGAVRHQGPIPWDDDVDIVMFRRDYEKLKQALLQAPSDAFEFVDAYSTKLYYTFIPKVFYRNSQMCNDGIGTLERNHLHLDIFLLDNTSNIKALRMAHGLLLKAVYGLAMGHRSDSQFSDRFAYSPAQKLAARSLSLMGRLVSLKTVRKWHKSIAMMFDNRETNYVFCTNNAPTCLGEKHSHSVSVYEKTINAPYGSGEMPIPSGYDAILRSGYSDYMTMPPENKRKPDHLIFSQAVVNGCYCKDAQNED